MPPHLVLDEPSTIAELEGEPMRPELELEDLRKQLIDAKRAARTCFLVIYEAGENVITDDQCCALSDEWPWLETTEN
jgi:hypothetical protein